MLSSARTSVLFMAPLALALFACEKPSPPKLKPESVVVKTVDASGLTVEVTLDAHNKNSVPLYARSVTAKIMLDGKIDLGEVEVATDVKLPSKKHTAVVAPLTLKWKDVLAIGLLAAQKPVIPFTVTGTAEIGTEDLNFEVPFETEGTLTREQLSALTVNAIPTIPKLPF
jgi:LEA14-like dessication related protein